MTKDEALKTLARLGQEIEADTPKIGCVQHDCDECKARLAQPAQRPWVGLTDEERKTLWASGLHYDTMIKVEKLLEGKNT